MDEIEKEMLIKERIAKYCEQVGTCSKCRFWRYGCKAEEYFKKQIG